MRTHRDIIRDATPAVVAEVTGSPITTVRSWAHRKSIPSDHWLALVAAGHCTSDELMIGATKVDRAA